MTFEATYTDLFGGEANFAWARRAIIRLSPDASAQAIVRAAKKAMGLSGMRGKTSIHGDWLEVRFSTTVLFIEYVEDTQ